MALLLTWSVVPAVAEIRIVGHRGASRDAPENTLPAFALAWKQGADAIEGDFHLTKDGHIVCLHDGNTKKVADENLVVADSTLSQLRTLDVGRAHGEKFRGAVIPTLAEVFATVPTEGKIYVEVKCGPEIIPRLLEEIGQTQLAREQIVVISFQKEVIQQVEEKAPDLKTAWLSSFRKDPQGRISPSPTEILQTLRSIKADAFSSSKDRATQAMVEAVKRGGFEYHVWTVDDIASAKKFQKWGARSITTNVPGLLKGALTD